MDATRGPISLVSASARPGTARTSAGASEATDSRCGLRWRPLGRVLVVLRGSAPMPSAVAPRWGSSAPRWGSCSPRWGSWLRAGGVRLRAGGVRPRAWAASRSHREAAPIGGEASHSAPEAIRLAVAGSPLDPAAFPIAEMTDGAAAIAAGRLPMKTEAGRARRKSLPAEAATRLPVCAGAAPRCSAAGSLLAASRLAGSGLSRCRIVIGSRSS